MTVLGIEGGGTRTTALLVDDQGRTLAEFAVGPGNVRLLDDDGLRALLLEIHDRLPLRPERIGAGMAGVRTASDHERLRRALDAIWPGVPATTSDDLLIALEAEDWKEGCTAQVLLLSGTGSCCLGRRRDGASVKIGGRGHIIGDRGSACDIAMHALKSTVTIFDIEAKWPQLGADMLAALQMNDPESLIEWSMTANKTEIASLAKVVFEAAASRRDEIAVAILHRAAERLSKDAISCAGRVAGPDEPVQVILNGSTILKNAWFVEDVKSRILAARPGATVQALTRSGAWGATRLALRAPATGRTAAAAPTSSAKTETPFRPVAAAPTEGRNPRSVGFAEMPLSDAIALMLSEDATLPAKVLAESAHIAWTIEAVTQAFAAGGRLFYCGAGTSGRLGVLDASECPPTFRTPASLVQGIIAGGRTALWSAVEGAEDDAAAGVGAIASRSVTSQDVVIGLSASGHAPFVWGCLAEARRRGAKTVLVACNPGYRDHPLVDRAILPDTGPEVLTGSTRLKAGTATKLVLNLITTLALARSGKVMSNLMVDLNPSNSKLRDRAVRIVRELTGAGEPAARQALEASGWVVRAACAALGGPRPPSS